MFEINPNLQVDTEYLEDSPIYYMDNFYDDPDEIVQYLLEIRPDLHKKDDYPTYNGIYFLDMRHDLVREIPHVYEYLSKICGQEPLENNVKTNCSRFRLNIFNNYEENYWWPHIDEGYTALVYLNKDDEENGTNLYKCLEESEEEVRRTTNEHYLPWRPKKYYELVKSIKPRYNRCVLFDAKRYLHGQTVSNKQYFGENFRLNQALFFRHE